MKGRWIIFYSMSLAQPDPVQVFQSMITWNFLAKSCMKMVSNAKRYNVLMACHIILLSSNHWVRLYHILFYLVSPWAVGCKAKGTSSGILFKSEFWYWDPKGSHCLYWKSLSEVRIMMASQPPYSTTILHHHPPPPSSTIILNHHPHLPSISSFILGILMVPSLMKVLVKLECWPS